MSIDINELLTRKEDLHEDLRPYLVDGPTLGKILQHPLAYAVPYMPAMNALINARYQYNLAQFERSMKDRNWECAVYTHERPYRWEALHTISESMNDEELARLFNSVWIDSENIWQNHEIIYDLICRLKNDKLKAYLMDADDLGSYQAMPSFFKVYRGCQKHNQKGLSWTLNKEKAIWFANRYGGKAMLVTGDINKSDVLFYTNARGEQEIVAVANDVVKVTDRQHL